MTFALDSAQVLCCCSPYPLRLSTFVPPYLVSRLGIYSFLWQYTQGISDGLGYGRFGVAGRPQDARAVMRFYHGVVERRGRKAALVAAARKLATVCYSVLVHGRPYFNPLDAQA